MADEERLDDDLTEFAETIARYKPRPAGLDTARLVFEAGRQAAQSTAPPVVMPQTPWYWPASTAAMTGLSAILAVLLAVNVSAKREAGLADVEHVSKSHDRSIAEDARDNAGAPERIATHDEASREASRSALASRRQFRLPPAWSNTPATRYIRDRDLVLAFGIDALPLQPGSRGTSSPRPVDRRALERELLGSASVAPEDDSAEQGDSGGVFEFGGFDWIRWFSNGENL